MRSLSRVKPGALVRVRLPRRASDQTGVVLAVRSRGLTVAIGWRERRHVRRQNVIEIVSRVGPLRPGGEYTSTRLSAAFDRAPLDRAPLDLGPPDDDGPDGGGEPFPIPAAS